MKRTRQILMVAAVLGVALFSCSKDDDNDVNGTDQTFVKQASVSNNAEIDAGSLAATNGNSTGVKTFGAFMVTEHGTAKSDLKTVGANVGLPVTDSIDAMHVALKQKLMTLSGRAFDSVYIMNQITDHQTTLANFDAEISSGNNVQIVNYANTYRPHIAMHLHMADSIAVAMKFK